MGTTGSPHLRFTQTGQHPDSRLKLHLRDCVAAIPTFDQPFEGCRLFASPGRARSETLQTVQ